MNNEKLNRVYKKILPIEKMSDEEKEDKILLVISKFLYNNTNNKSCDEKYDYIKQIYKPRFMELMFCEMICTINNKSNITNFDLEVRIDTDIHNNGGYVFCLIEKTKNSRRLYFLDTYCDIDHFPEELLIFDKLKSFYKTTNDCNKEITLLDAYIFNIELLPNFKSWKLEDYETFK